MEKLNHILDQASEFFAHRKGLLPVLGIFLILLNWTLQFIPGLEGLANTNSFLHLGVILAIVGFMLAWAL